MTWSTPKRVAALEEALRAIPGVTVQPWRPTPQHASTQPLLVFFEVEDPRWLYLVGRAVDRNYGGYGFRCELSTTDLPEHAVGYLLTSEAGGLRGPALLGRAAYPAAAALAARIRFLLSPEAAHIRAAFHLPHLPGAD